MSSTGGIGSRGVESTKTVADILVAELQKDQVSNHYNHCY